MYTDIDIQQYQDEFEKSDKAYQLIDVREVDEYEEGRIPGTVNLPLSNFQELYTQIDTDKPVVMICARGGRSAQASAFLVANGYTDVYNLQDGTMGWMAEGLPIED